MSRFGECVMETFASEALRSQMPTRVMIPMFSSARLTTLCRSLRLGPIRVGAHVPLRAFAVSTMLLCFSSSGLLAGEVSVAYAIDADGQQDSGKMVCDYQKSCSINSVGLKLFVILIFDPDMRRVQVSISGNYGRPGCCYFSGGEMRTLTKMESSIQRFPFFEGRPRQGNELIENSLAGTLYLAFHE
jgi:hypothetical protein